MDSTPEAVANMGGRCTGESDELEGTTKTQNAAARCVHAHALEQIEGRATRSRRRGECRVRRQPDLGRCRQARRYPDCRRHGSAPRSTRSLPKASLSSCRSTASRRTRTTRGPSFRTRRSPSSRKTSLCAASFSRSSCVALAEDGRYRVLFGAKRLRAARQAALETVPVVIGSDAHDVYAQVAENQKRHGLTPLDLARFMRSRVDAGESNAEIARRMGIDLTSVAHHLALLTLPPELDEALRSGRCTSPRTLYELAKLQKTKPERVKAIVSRRRRDHSQCGRVPQEGDLVRRELRLAKRPHRAGQLPRRPGERSVRAPRIAPRADDEARRLRSPPTNWRPCVGAWPISPAVVRVGPSDPLLAAASRIDRR